MRCITDKVNLHLSKKMKTKSKSVKSLRYMDEFFFPTNDIVVVSIHIILQTSKHLDSNKTSLQLYILNRRGFPAFI